MKSDGLSISTWSSCVQMESFIMIRNLFGGWIDKLGNGNFFQLKISSLNKFMRFASHCDAVYNLLYVWSMNAVEER